MDNRGLADIFSACGDDLNSSLDAIEAVLPTAVLRGLVCCICAPQPDLRKITKTRGSVPTDDGVFTLFYLALAVAVKITPCRSRTESCLKSLHHSV